MRGKRVLRVLVILSFLFGTIPATGSAAQPSIDDTANASTTCEIEDDLDQASKQCLIDRYSPVFHFHRDEQYRPTSIEKFVAEARMGVLNENVTLDELANEDRDLEIDSAQYTYRNSDLPRVVYASVHPDTEYTPPDSVTPKDYVAVTFWTFYFHDNKAALRDKFGDDVVSAVNPEEHQSDFESVTILVNASGPHWVGVSQHLGGELRPWDQVQTERETHPRLYVAEGAHSLYFTNSERYGSRGIFGQEHHLDADSHSTMVNQGWISSVPASMASNAGLIYIDITGNYSTWVQEGTQSENSLERKTYRVEILTGDEPWQRYEGSFIDSEVSKSLIGDAVPPAQRDRWKTPGEWLEDRPVYYDTQVVPEVGWQLFGLDKGGFNNSVATIKTKIRNVGPQPGTIYTRVTVRNPDGTVIGETVREVPREAGTFELYGDETIHVDLYRKPSARVNVSIEVFTNHPRLESPALATLSGEICSEWYRCLL